MALGEPSPEIGAFIRRFQVSSHHVRYIFETVFLCFRIMLLGN